MNYFIDTLSDALLSKKLENCSLDELETLLQKHPYTSTLQLLYAKKLKEADHKNYGAQLQKTLLYYRNPLFIDLLIKGDDPFFKVENEKTETSSSLTKQETIEAPIVLEKSDTTLSLETEKGQEEIEETENLETAENLPSLPQFKIEAIDPSKAEFTFTPYYTVDYFAAQGIKLNEQNTTDRFGTQLKSFTAWLKHMKRLPGANIKTSNITILEEKSIEKMAEQSLNGENADTEAMAEVWVKQGNPKKAIDIYKKLSLQIPRKSAYFAAKIDHLKR